MGDVVEGAAIGQHKVVILDLIQNETRDADGPPGSVPIRFSPIYSSATTTTLTASLQPGNEQTVDFQLTR